MSHLTITILVGRFENSSKDSKKSTNIYFFSSVSNHVYAPDCVKCSVLLVTEHFCHASLFFTHKTFKKLRNWAPGFGTQAGRVLNVSTGFFKDFLKSYM